MKRELTLEEVEQQPENAPLWVINTSGDHDRTAQIGELILQVPIPDSPPEQIILHATWLPVNLTDRIPRKYLLSTTLLRRYRSEGLIRFITSEYAKVLNESSGAEEERKELDMRRSRISRASVAKTLENSPVQIRMNSDDDDTPVVSQDDRARRRGTVPEVADPTPVFSQQYETWKVDSTKLNDVQTLNSLRSRGRTFTRDELKDLVDSGALAGKPQTKASVLRNLKASKRA